MNKKEFIKFFNCTDEELLGRIYDKIHLCIKTNKSVSVNEFLPPAIWSNLQEVSQELGVSVAYWKSFDECEKRFAIFYIEYLYEDFPINILRIKNKSKFTKLRHKDYLGAIMSLGIKRTKLGDLVVNSDCAYVPIVQEMNSYIVNNLAHINNCPCIIESYNYNDIEFPQSEFSSLDLISTSFRLDCVISSITKQSRNLSNELLAKGRVLLNYGECKRKDKLIKENDIVTIKGYGKYKIRGIVGSTQKNRLKINVLEFK
ncbi:RNA-binding protein [Hathewaya histolytica]|uniref:YlmH family RNA-binding protein n=1 Tax=Hathewaya histolytica TaxID=1498 RepID=UPI003B67FA8B